MDLEAELGRSWTLYNSGSPLEHDNGRLAVPLPVSEFPGAMGEGAAVVGDAPTPKAFDSTARVVGAGIRDTMQQTTNLGAELIDAGSTAITGKPVGALDKVKNAFPQIEMQGTGEEVGRAVVNIVSSLLLTRGAGLRNPAMVGAAVDALLDPEQGNFSTLIKDLGIQNELLDFLDSRVGEDATAEQRLYSRMQNALEGVGVGYLLDAAFGAIKGIKNNPEIAAKIAGGLAVAGAAYPQEAEGGMIDKVARAAKGTITKLAKTEGETAAEYVARMNREAPIVTDAQSFVQHYGDVPQTSAALPSDAVAVRSADKSLRDYVPNLPTGEINDKATAASAFAQVGGYFDSLVRMKNGGQPRVWTDPANKAQILDEAAHEVKFQLGQADPTDKNLTKKTGFGWYDEDITSSFNRAAATMPELRVGANRGVRIPWNGAKDNVTPEQARILVAAIGAPQSFGNPANRNFDIALQAYEEFRRTGHIPEQGIFLNDQGAVESTGKYWTQRAVSQQYLGVLNTLIRELGPAKAANWLVEEHSIAELRDLKRRATTLDGEQIFKGDSSMGISGKANETRQGAFIFGPKGGQFMGNLLGFPGTTTDMWFSRTWNRYLGTSREGLGALSETGVVEQPRNLAERGHMADFSRQLTDQLNSDTALVTRMGRPLTERDTQAVLWYFEQQLYNDLGIRVKPTSFGEGADSYAKRAKQQGGTGIQSR